MDWRFLLPDPRLRRVAYVGPRDHPLLAAVERSADVVSIVDGRDDVQTELVVAADPSRRDLAHAKAALSRTGGYVYIEVSRPFRPAYRSMVRRAGFSQVAVHWHFPGFVDRRALVPLRDRTAYMYALSRRESRAVDRAAAATARLLGPSTPVLAGRDVSFIACCGRAIPETAAAAALRRADLPALLDLELADGFSELLLTPTQTTSHAVVSLVIPHGRRQPALVVKQTRLSDASPLEREAANLRALHLRWSAAAAVAPQALGTVGLVPSFVQTALDGRALEPAEVRRRGDRGVEDVAAALIDLAVGTSGRGTGSWYAGFEDELAEASAPAELVAATLRATSALRDSAGPSVFEHGDVAHSNVLALASGGTGFVDWESARADGAPLHDLLFFVAYAATARAAAATPTAHAAAFERVFREPTRTEFEVIRSYVQRLQLPQALIPPLFVACWARRAARIREATAGPAIERWKRALALAPHLPWATGGS